jgi:hypothetical protein
MSELRCDSKSSPKIDTRTLGPRVYLLSRQLHPNLCVHPSNIRQLTTGCALASRPPRRPSSDARFLLMPTFLITPFCLLMPSFLLTCHFLSRRLFFSRRLSPHAEFLHKSPFFSRHFSSHAAFSAHAAPRRRRATSGRWGRWGQSARSALPSRTGWARPVPSGRKVSRPADALPPPSPCPTFRHRTFPWLRLNPIASFTSFLFPEHVLDGHAIRLIYIAYGRLS